MCLNGTPCLLFSGWEIHSRQTLYEGAVHILRKEMTSRIPCCVANLGTLMLRSCRITGYPWRRVVALRNVWTVPHLTFIFQTTNSYLAQCLPFLDFIDVIAFFK